MANPFNELTMPQADRLALLLEEMNKARQIIGKILRYGYGTRSPLLPTDSPNDREALERKMGDVLHALERLEDAGDINYSHDSR